MDFKEEIVQFMTDKVGGITIVAEGSAEIVYADSYFRKNTEMLSLAWMQKRFCME